MKVEFAIQTPIVFESFQRHDDNVSAEMVGKETGLVVLVRWFFFYLKFLPMPFIRNLFSGNIYKA